MLFSTKQATILAKVWKCALKRQFVIAGITVSTLKCIAITIKSNVDDILSTPLIVTVVNYNYMSISRLQCVEAQKANFVQVIVLRDLYNELHCQLPHRKQFVQDNT